jgi:hypothetical protein
MFREREFVSWEGKVFTDSLRIIDECPQEAFLRINMQPLNSTVD